VRAIVRFREKCMLQAFPCHRELRHRAIDAAAFNDRRLRDARRLALRSLRRLQVRCVAIDPALQPARQAQDERIRADARVRPNARNSFARFTMSSKEIGNKRQHVVHLRVAAFVGRLPRGHRVGAHPKTFDPAVEKLVWLVEREIVVDEIAEPPRDLACEPRDAVGEAWIEWTGSATGGLNVERPGVVHERDDRRHLRIADRLQDIAIVREGLVAPETGLGLEPGPRERQAKDATTEAASKLNVFAKAIPKICGLAACNQRSHVLPDVANVVALVVGFALMVGGSDAEFKVARHGLQMRGGAGRSLSML
jgi:hypothetical protein